MNTHDEYYAIQSSLRNLGMLKMIYDSGIDVKDYPSYTVDFDFGGDEGFSIFYKAVNELFTIAEWFFPHNTDEEAEQKKYWIRQYCQGSYLSEQDNVDSVGVLVIMDDRIDQRKVETGSVGGSDFCPGFAEVTSCPNGIILWWDEDDGGVDWVDVLYLILSSLPKEEDLNNEMAI